MNYSMLMARWTGVLGVILLVGCGGRSQSDGLPASSTDGASGIGGAVNDEPASGGSQDGRGGRPASGGGGGSTINAIDAENRASGAPVAPTPSAIFWRWQEGAWKIGNWFWFSDGVHDVGLSPIEPPRDASTQARQVSGSGFLAGVVLWLELDHPQRRALDLSTYAGLTFWARLSSSSGKLDVLLNDGSSNPMAWSSPPPPSSLSVAIGPEWQEVTLPFEAFGVPASKVVSIDFHVGDGGESFDLWIDDLTFFCVGTCP